MSFLTGVIAAVTKKRRARDFQPWHGVVLLAVILVAVVLGLMQRFGTPVAPAQDAPEVPVILNAETCALSGGTWNSCGSACRTMPDVPCIELCIEYCECASDAQCPFGSTCRDIIDGIGVCSSGSSSSELSF